MTNQILQLLKSNREFYNRFREDFTYHSSVIEGSTITREEHHSLATIGIKQLTNGVIKISRNKFEEAIENLNCLKLFDFIINNLNVPLSHETVWKYQKILKNDTNFQTNLPNETGSYRKSDVKVGSHYPHASHKVYQLMDLLINNFNYRKNLLIDDIADFHAQFEQIHPFRDGNGRVGRMIALQQCLTNNVVPFTVNIDTRSTYINCLEIYHLKNDILPLTKYFLEQQKIFIQKYQQYFNVAKAHDAPTLNQIKVIDYLKLKKYANRIDLQKHVHLKIAATKNLLSQMVKNNLIKVVGKGRSSSYTIV